VGVADLFVDISHLPARVSTLPAQRPGRSSDIGAVLLISVCCVSSETKTTGGFLVRSAKTIIGARAKAPTLHFSVSRLED
jgi:hypothetical protein